METINKKDVERQLDFFGHKTFWFHAFKPCIDGKRQPGDLYSEFCSKERVIELCEKYNGRGLCCVAINERPVNKTKTEDVKEIGVLFIDVDVHKALKEGHVSKQEHHAHAIKQSREIRQYLESLGFLVGLIVDSGNGTHIFIKLEDRLIISSVEERQAIIDKCVSLENNLRTRFNDRILNVDYCTKDLNRRVKLAGTLNIKDTTQTENRLARILFLRGEIDE